MTHLSFERVIGQGLLYPRGSPILSLSWVDTGSPYTFTFRQGHLAVFFCRDLLGRGSFGGHDLNAAQIALVIGFENTFHVLRGRT